MEIDEMPDIDSLSIRITSSSKEAERAIDSIISSLDKLNGALTSSTSTSALLSLTTSLNSISRITIPASNFAGIDSLVKSLGKLGGENAQRASTVLPELGTAFTEMATRVSAAPQINENIIQLASSLSKLGGQSAQRAVTVIPELGTAFSNLLTQLSKAPAVSNNVVRLAEALSKFNTEGSKATTSAKSFTNSFKNLKLNPSAFTNLLHPLGRLRLGFTSLAAVFGKLYANFFLLIRGAKALGRAMDYSSSMTEAQNVVAVTFGKQAGVLDDFAQTAIKDFGMARLSATEFASRFQAMGSTMGITASEVVKANDFITSKISGNTRAYKDLGNSVANMSVNLTKLTADMASLYNQDYADVAQDMQAIFTGMTRPLRKYGMDLTQATLKEWALANGLNADIEKMSQAEKTMLRYQYVMTRASGAMGDFAKTADTWANAMRTVKQLLQEIARTIGEALINALRPALLAFRDFLSKFLTAAQSALNALGKLMGWKQINFGAASLTEDTEDYVDALEDAAGAAKKLKGQLRGIDELNNLTTNNKNGGGAGGIGSIGAEVSDWLDSIEDSEKPYESAIKDWFEFGTKISYSIRDGLASIDWKSIYGKASEFGHNLAEFLNGLIRPDTFAELGKTLAGGLMTAIEFAFEFGDTFDWVKAGNSIANGITGFFKEFDGGKLANTIDVWVQGIWTMLKTAWTQLFGDEEKRKELFEDVTDFVLNLDGKTVEIMVGLGTTILGVGAIATLIATELASTPIAVPAILISAGTGYLVGKKAGELLAEAMGKNSVSGENRYDEMWDEAFGFYANILHLKEIMEDPDKITSDTGKLLYALGENRENIEKGMDRSQRMKIFRERAGFDKEDGKVWWQKSPAELLLEKLYSEENLKKQIGKDKNNDYNSKAMLNTIPRTAFDDVRDEFKQEFEDWWSGFFDDLKLDKVILWAGEVKDKLIEGFSLDEILLEDALKNIWPTLENKATEIGTWLDEKSSEIYDRIENFLDEKFGKPIEEKLGDLKDFFSTWWNDDMLPWFKDTILVWFSDEKWNEILQPIRKQFKYAFQAGANFAVGALNKVLEGIENMLNGAGDLFNALIDLASSILKKDLEHWGRITIPRIATPYANGGYPQVGSLFLAGEAGSEMVGTINGRTGVVSNGEITGIADAIRSTSDTEIQLLRQQNTLLQGILNKEFGISSDSIFNSVRSSARDFTNRTGDPAFT